MNLFAEMRAVVLAAPDELRLVPAVQAGPVLWLPGRRAIARAVESSFMVVRLL